MKISKTKMNCEKLGERPYLFGDVTLDGLVAIDVFIEISGWLTKLRKRLKKDTLASLDGAPLS